MRKRWKMPECPVGVIIEVSKAEKGKIPYVISRMEVAGNNKETAEWRTRALQRYNSSLREYHLLPMPEDYSQRQFLWNAFYSLRPNKARDLNKSYLLCVIDETSGGLGLAAAAPTQAPIFTAMNTTYAKSKCIPAYMHHVSPRLDFNCSPVVFKIKENIWEDTRV